MSQMDVYHYVNVSEKILYHALKGIRDVDVRQVVRLLSVNAGEREIFVIQKFELYEQMNQKHRVLNFLSHML